MADESETKRVGASTDLLEKIRDLRIEKARVGAEMSRLNERLKELSIQIGAYEDAASMVFGESHYIALMAAIEGNILARNALTTDMLGGLLSSVRDVFEPTSKKKNLSESWARLLVSMAEHESFSYDDLVTMSEIMEFDVAKPTMRSQIKTYVDSGLVERIENERGRFRVTPLGRATAQSALPKPEPQRAALVEALTDKESDSWSDLETLLEIDPSWGSGGSKNIFE